MSQHGQLLALAQRVANLNENVPEIGHGMLTQLVTEARAALAATEGASDAQGWQYSPPPTDGTQIIAIGNVIWTSSIDDRAENDVTGVSPFIQRLRWDATGVDSGWRLDNGLSFTASPADTVRIDAWIIAPDIANARG